jgi:hypothetical protein
MATITSVPVTIPPEVASRVAELGMQHEFKMMLEHLKQTVPGLRSIRVELDERANMWEKASIILWTHRTDPGPGDDPTHRDWIDWYVRTFSPDVCRHFAYLSIYEAADGR